MRTALAFVLGLLIGAAFALLLRAPDARSPSSRGTARARSAGTAVTARQAQEEVNAARRGGGLSPANAPTEKAMAGEPQHKEVPPLTSPTLVPDSIAIPVVDVGREDLRDMFNERRGTREHRAIDIAAPRGTPVVAAIDGRVAKLFLSKAGGITVYEYDPGEAMIYYYAHLDGYASGLFEGQPLRRGDVIGFVGTSGNAPPNAPHLHFAIEKLTEPGRWWKSDPVNPYPLLMARGVTLHRASAPQP